MRYLNGSIACATLCGPSLVGCMKDEPAPKSGKAPTTMMSASSTTKPAMATTAPAAAPAVVAMTEKDMTHEVMAEAPMFTSMPVADDAAPAMMLKAGDKVLVMVPRGKYAQITTVGGVKGYVTTASLKPIGN